MLPFKIGFRFLKSSLGQTVLIILGISVGVSVQVFIGSLIGGLQASLVDTTIGNASQITIKDEEYLSDYNDIFDDIKDIEGLETISYAFNKPGNIIIDDDSSPVLLRGFDLDLAEGIYELEDKIVEGTLPNNDNEIIMGLELFEEQNLSLGDTITIAIPLIGESEVTVVGVYDFNVSSINNSWVISNLETAQTVVGEADSITAIEIQLDDVFEAETLAATIESKIDASLDVSNWIESNQELLSGLEAQGSSSLMIQVFVTISVVLGITSVLAITVIQKSRQIGILKAMGIKDRTASFIFLSQGFILGLFGAIFGVLLGLFLTWTFSTFALGPDGEPVVPLLLDPQFIMISALVALFSASFASLLPARKSSKVSVIEVIKNG